MVSLTSIPNKLTIKLISYDNGKDVSNSVEIDIWIPKNIDFDDEKDIYCLLNFKRKITSEYTTNISLDISDYICVWIEIDHERNSIYSNDYHLVIGNGLHTLLVYDLSMLPARLINEYGKTIKDPYGSDVKYITVRDLLPFRDCDGVMDNHQNRAVWAYLNELPKDTKIALFWS